MADEAADVRNGDRSAPLVERALRLEPFVVAVADGRSVFAERCGELRAVEAFAGCVRVRDEARREDDDSITVFGRGSNCINSGGEKIFPEEVEQALKAHPGVFDCLVVATPDERFGSKVTAVVAVREDATISLASVQGEARKHIASYKIPRELHVVDEVPRAPSGKPAYPKATEIALAGTHRVG